MDCFRLRSSSYGGQVASLAMTWKGFAPTRWLHPGYEAAKTHPVLLFIEASNFSLNSASSSAAMSLTAQ
jgi:hypothetical protein